MEKISIIILNYELPKTTLNCIESIIKNTKDIDYEIILIDNGSTNKSLKLLKSLILKRKNIKFIPLKKNLGFGKANNIGIKKSSGEYLFFINNDILFYENSLKILLREFKKMSIKNTIGFLQPRLFLDKEKNIIQKTNAKNPKLFNLFQENIKLLQKINKNDFYNFRYERWNRNTSKCVDVICGAAIFCRKEFLFKLGGFDERFFLYFEEYDLCKRSRVLNRKNYYTVETSLIHLHNSSPSPFLGKKIIYISSFIKFVIKHYFNLRFIY